MLATSGANQDAERKPIDTIVIHHTANAPGMTRERLSAMHTGHDRHEISCS